MLKQAENDVFTRVGPGTPAGELLRRYWHPVAMAADLSEDNPTKGRWLTARSTATASAVPIMAGPS
jgi:hypothetical protein